MTMRGWISKPGDPAWPVDTAVMTPLSQVDAALWIAHAFDEGFINAAQRDELLLYVANSGDWGLYIVRRGLTYHDAADDAYLGNVKALAGQAFAEATAPFDYLDVVQMDIDYHAGVFFGSVGPNAHKIVTGDFDWGGALPTAQNLGNVPLHLSFLYSPMTKPAGQPDDVINVFDLQFQASSWTDAQKEVFDPVAAGTQVALVKPFPLCNRAKMNFSLTTPPNIQPGEYSGTFKIMFSKFPI